MRWVFILLLVALPTALQAGAWARGKGNVYLSFAVQGDEAFGPELSLYGEYGLSKHITLGMKIFEGSTGQTDEFLSFATLHLNQNRPLKFALSLGAGVDRPDNGDYRGTARIGVHLGYGLQNGWIALDAFAQTSAYLYPPYEIPAPNYKLDVTYGRHLNDRLTAIIQVQTGNPNGSEFYAKISPALSTKIWKTDVAVGAVIGFQNNDTTAVFFRASKQF